MSGDFEVAVEEGATMVRVGTAIFGARPPLGTRA
jgi:PLP dependent protein